ncbi:hypothetical protein EU534_01755 [Candidatus Heimdallarchaeota archaeon]|nr:MAG: hypothetical protein EU534_01755 [Candidatus Heimdallarchaeota archaeon]
MKERNPKTTVFILSTIATILSGALGIGLIYLYKYIESQTGPISAIAWGILAVILCFLFAVFYMLGYKLYEKRSIHENNLDG